MKTGIFTKYGSPEVLKRNIESTFSGYNAITTTRHIVTI